MKYYDLWNAETGNLIASCRTQGEALGLVRETITLNDREAVGCWALIWGDDEDDEAGEMIADGAGLADLASMAVPSATSVAPS